MPKQIIILETNPADGGMITINAVFWFPVLAEREVPQPGFQSAYRGAITAQELTDLQDGKVIEERKALQYPKSFTQAQIQGALAAAWTDRKAYLDSLPNTGQFYGRSWDGAGWVAAS